MQKIFIINSPLCSLVIKVLFTPKTLRKKFSSSYFFLYQFIQKLSLLFFQKRQYYFSILPYFNIDLYLKFYWSVIISYSIC